MPSSELSPATAGEPGRIRISISLLFLLLLRVLILVIQSLRPPLAWTVSSCCKIINYLLHLTTCNSQQLIIWVELETDWAIWYESTNNNPVLQLLIFDPFYAPSMEYWEFGIRWIFIFPCLWWRASKILDDISLLKKTWTCPLSKNCYLS